MKLSVEFIDQHRSRHIVNSDHEIHGHISNLFETFPGITQVTVVCDGYIDLDGRSSVTVYRKPRGSK